jgi:Fe-S-cluster-containing dehydrogenase component
MTKCIGCRSCEIACNEQNGTPADIRWRRIGESEGGTYPDTQRHYLSMGCNHCLDADCVKGCPVEAYTKDPITGIVLHSADACASAGASRRMKRTQWRRLLGAFFASRRGQLL